MLFRSNREPNFYLYLSLYAIFLAFLQAFLELQVEKSSLTNSPRFHVYASMLNTNWKKIAILLNFASLFLTSILNILKHRLRAILKVKCFTYVLAQP